jgi:hypothetical protein
VCPLPVGADPGPWAGDESPHLRHVHCGHRGRGRTEIKSAGAAAPDHDGGRVQESRVVHVGRRGGDRDEAQALEDGAAVF